MNKKLLLSKFLLILMLGNLSFTPMIHASSDDDDYVKRLTQESTATTIGSTPSETELSITSILNELKTATRTMSNQPAVLTITGETAIVGDIHGDADAMKIIVEKLTAWLNEKGKGSRRVLFLGDVFDRGNTPPTLYALLKFFNQFNTAGHNRVYVLRGNHETLGYHCLENPGAKSIGEFDSMIGSNEELKSEWRKSLENYFDNLPHAAVVNGKVLATHGGIPVLEDANEDGYKQDLETVFGKSATKVCGNQGVLYDMIWSDFNPKQTEVVATSNRGAGCIFNWTAVERFFAAIKEIDDKYKEVNHIIHGHQHLNGPCDTVRPESADDMAVTTIISSPKIRSLTPGPVVIGLVDEHGNVGTFGEFGLPEKVEPTSTENEAIPGTESNPSKTSEVSPTADDISPLRLSRTLKENKKLREESEKIATKNETAVSPTNVNLINSAACTSSHVNPTLKGRESSKTESNTTANLALVLSPDSLGKLPIIPNSESVNLLYLKPQSEGQKLPMLDPDALTPFKNVELILIDGDIEWLIMSQFKECKNLKRIIINGNLNRLSDGICPDLRSSITIFAKNMCLNKGLIFLSQQPMPEDIIKNITKIIGLAVFGNPQKPHDKNEVCASEEIRNKLESFLFTLNATYTF